MPKQQPSTPAADRADLDFGERYRSAISKLAGAQKSTEGVGAYLRFVNRPVGGRLAALGHGLGWTPNHLTAISAALSAAGIAVLALARPTIAGSMAVAILLLAGYAFDSADGQLSRVRGGGGPAGEWLDHVVDIAKTASLHMAVAVSLFRFGDMAAAWLLVPLAFGVVHITFFFAMMLRDQLGAKPPKSHDGSPASISKSLLLLPMDYGLLAAIMASITATHVFLSLYSGLGLIVALFSVRSLPKAYRRLDALS